MNPFLSQFTRITLPSIAACALLLVLIGCQDKEKSKEVSDEKLARLKVPDGFKADRLYGASDHNDGSWVSMAFDPKGRLYASDQYGALYRMTIPVIGSKDSVQIERINIVSADHKSDTVLNVGYAQGLLYAFNSLYVMINHTKDDKFEKGSGLYRLEDKDNDDQFESMTMLREFDASGEHGPHSIIVSPDKKSLYFIAGNYTKAPKMDHYRVLSNYKEDNILPLYTDPNGHATELRAPGGWIASIDPDGKNMTMLSNGYRNAYDLTLNEAGDLFAYDSDMEWDFGLPWYRPTRICHVTSGSEFGWRTGSTPWSPSNPDNLPPVINIGQGSPTNLVYAGAAKFPARYKHALLAFDWSFGIVYAIHLTPDGSTYNATGEEFISGTPLPLTDGVIGPDGALYFLTGGRRLESDLYRVYYAGDSATQELPAAEINDLNKLRREMEVFHVGPTPGAVEKIWPNLGHEDRFIRFASRVALEHQPVAEWQAKALAEKNDAAVINTMIALARQGKPAVQNQIFASLMKIDFSKLKESQQIDLVRAFELTLLRMGNPAGPTKANVIAYLDKHYPAQNNLLNRALSKVMVALEAPSAVEKTMALLANAKDDSGDKLLTSSADLILRNPQYGMDIAKTLSSAPAAQQTYYATVLSASKTGWNDDLHKKYFEWFYNAFSYKGGNSFRGYIDKLRKAALENAGKDKFAFYNKISGDSLVSLTAGIGVDKDHQPKGPGRNWELTEALELTKDGIYSRNFENGKNMFAAVLCSACHTMKDNGGAAGPNLTQLGTRFSAKDILEAIIEPSRTISDQYAAVVFTLKDGKTVVGRVVTEDDTKYSVSQNPFAPRVVRELLKSEVASTRASKVSSMPEGTMNRLNEDELKDLLAYLMSGGNPDADVYKAKK
ncbi:MAG: heme-binding protein [Chryseolinea sp.]